MVITAFVLSFFAFIAASSALFYIYRISRFCEYLDARINEQLTTEIESQVENEMHQMMLQLEAKYRHGRRPS